MAVDQKMSKYLRKHGPAVDHSLRAQTATEIIDEIAHEQTGERECDCCGAMKSDTHFIRVPYVGDTVVCEDCLP